MEIKNSKYFSHLGLLLSVAIILSLININKAGLNGDEIITCNIVTGFGHTPTVPSDTSNFRKAFWSTSTLPLGSPVFTQHDFWKRQTLRNVIRFAVNDNGNSISYDIGFYYWIKTVGFSLITARLFSVIFFLLSVVFLYKLCLNITASSRVSFASTLLLILHPMSNYYAHLARCYSMTMSLSIITTYFLVLILDRRRTNTAWLYILYGFLTGVCLLSHYLSLYVFIFHGFLCLCNIKYIFRRKKILAGMAVAFIIAASLFLSWYLTFGAEGRKVMLQQDAFILFGSSAQTRTGLISILQGCLTQLTAIFGNYFQYLGFRMREITILLAVPLLLIALNSKQLIHNYKNIFLGCICMIGLSIGQGVALSLLSKHTSSLHARYGFFAVPAAMILMGLIASVSKNENRFIRTLNYFLFIVLLLNMLLSSLVISTYTLSAYNDNPDYKSELLAGKIKTLPLNDFCTISEKIIDQYKQTDTVIYNNWQTAQYVNLFLDKQIIINQRVDTLSRGNYLKKPDTKIDLLP